MKHIFSLIIILLMINNSYSEIKPIFKDFDMNRIEYKTDKLIAFESTYSLYEDGTPYFGGGDIIYSINAGQTWDTLKSWGMHFWEPKETDVRLWKDIKMMFFFDESTLCMMHSDGLLLRYDLQNNKCDTTDLIPRETIGTSRVHYNVLDSKSAIISNSWHDSVHITYDKGLTWRNIYRTPSHPDLTPPFSPVHPVLINYNYDYFHLVVTYYTVHSPFGSGYKDYPFNIASYLYSNNEEKYTFRYITNEANVFYAKFLNDSVALLPGHRAYFMKGAYPMYDFSMDSVFNKPMVYKTTNAGKTWEIAMESEYFAGRALMELRVYGDTIMYPFRTADNIGYFVSYDMGDTWERVDLQNIKKENETYWGFDIISPEVGIVGIQEPGSRLASLYSYKFSPSSSVPLDPIFAPEVRLYPNPAVDYVTIDYDSPLIADEIAIYDMLGNQVKPSAVFVSSGSIMLNAANLPIGAYTVRITLNSNIITKSFIKR